MYQNDPRPPIHISDIHKEWKDLYFSKKSNKHYHFGPKIDSVLNALILLDNPDKYVQPREIKGEIIRNNWPIGADSSKEIKTLLEFFVKENKIDHPGDYEGYQLKDKVLPRPDVYKIRTYKLDENHDITDFIYRIGRLRDVIIPIDEPQVARIIMGVLAELFIFLDNIEEIEDKRKNMIIEKTTEKIWEYLRVLSKYTKGKKARDENIVYNQLIEALNELKRLPFKRKKRPEGDGDVSR
ncbi:MAG: hypothetical protein FP824_07225 [Euryarchaeota archaeon]|nr:hypothetical protein [Euryarchaeota archaeon]